MSTLVSQLRFAAIAPAVLSLAAFAQLAPTDLNPVQIDPYCDGATIPTPLDPRGPLVAADVPADRIELPPTDPTNTPGSITCGGQPVGYTWPSRHLGILGRAAWTPLPDGRVVARVELHSARATALRITLDGAPLPADAELRLYSPGVNASQGPYTSLDIAGPQWWSPAVFGDSIGIEIVATEVPINLPEIAATTYIWGSLGQDYQDRELGCYNDVACSSNWLNTASGVGFMLFSCNPGGGVNLPTACVRCSGSLINRQPSDLNPLFLTAFHCINNQSTASTLTVVWNFQQISCGGSVPALNTLPQTVGSTLISSMGDSDTTLLGLDQNLPGGLTLNGWDAGSLFPGNNITGIHHPGGTRKRISFGNFLLYRTHTCQSPIPPNYSILDVRWTNGTTEPGSSGSPALDDSGRIRGVLSCGPSPAECAPTVVQYGSFVAAYSDAIGLKYTINSADIARPMYVDNGSTSPERGAYGNPYQTVRRATAAVISGDDVLIDTGTYREQITIRRPMTLRAINGPVRLGPF